MMSAASDSLLSIIEARWAELVDVSSCAKILDFIEREHPESLSRITFLDLSRITGLQATDKKLFDIVRLFTARFVIFDVHFVYINNRGEPHDLTDEESSYFMNTGSLIDPDRGERVDGAGSHIHPFFSTSKERIGDAL